ncbi:fibroblast growth factor-binding protein 1 [Danio aesculapii]|uniref:fibroblast growth factor-binding protein 1 n=1 Tax=Danio aesculapii TaxID=1142201 RepID=UPI0024BFAF5B|nr:fibroblast growth factor-binding protein 1 [Danio aesculapii]
MLFIDTAMRGRSLLFLISLLFLLHSFSEAKKKSKQPSEAVARSDITPINPSLGSGQLSTKDGHRCTWETLERGANIVLQVSCSVAGEDGLKPPYTCQFAGKPQECSIYSSQSSQYWKQVVSKLKKRNNACEGEKVLKTRLCKKAPSASHMKLTERSGEETTTHMSEGMQDGKRKTDVPAKKEKDVQKEEKEEEEEEKKKDEDDGVGGIVNDEFSDMEPGVSYCGEGWHSVCRFFVKFFDG